MDFVMNIDYFVGSWKNTRLQTFHSKYLRVELSPYETCKNVITKAYHRNLHNLACGISVYGSYEEVIMSAIFHFSIFDIDTRRKKSDYNSMNTSHASVAGFVLAILVKKSYI